MTQKYNNDFYSNLKKCLVELYEFTEVESVKKLLDIYDKLDMSKIMNKYLETMDTYDRELKNRNDIMFANPITLFPAVDMSIVWVMLNIEQKNVIWTYLQLLYSACKVMLQSTPLCGNEGALESLTSDFSFNINENMNDSHKKIFNNEVTNIMDKINKLENLDLGKKKNKTSRKKQRDNYVFDPYAGVGNSSETFSVNDLVNNLNLETEEQKNGGLFDTVSNLINNNGSGDELLSSVIKMLNLDDALKNIENVSDDKIDEGSDMVKNVINSQLGGNSETGSFINEIVCDITDEFKNGFKNKKLNSLEQIMNISNEVARKIMPKMENKDIKIEDLLKSSLDMFAQSSQQFNNNQKMSKHCSKNKNI